MSDYTIQLDRVFHGPMDLLLHLVKEQEVEIHEVQIHRIIEGFLAYLEKLEALDLELAGDFVVMAARLMAIKSRSLLPKEEVDLEDDLDPSDELIGRLIEYRRFKVASENFLQLFDERALSADRGFRGEVKEHAEEPTLELGELSIFDLLAAHSRLIRETEARRPHQVARDPRPLRWYVDRVVDRVKGAQEVSLSALLDGIDGGPTRESLVGSFCALLELCRMGVIRVDQELAGGDIQIRRHAESDEEIDALLGGLTLEEDEDGDNADPAATMSGSLAPSPPLEHHE